MSRVGRATRGLVLASTAVLVASCSAPEGAGAPGGEGSGENDGRSIVIGAPSEPDTLNPLLGYAPNGSSKIFDGLLAYDADLHLKPALATSMPEVSDDGLTYTFQLRKGARFHDGKPFTARDVVFTYRTALDPDTNTALSVQLDAIKSVRATGKHTVIFTLKYPYAPFPKRATLGIVPEHVLAGKDVNSAEFNRNPIGTGPFTFESWRGGERLVLAANENYWGGEPAIQRVTAVFLADDATRATRLAAGELDAAVLTPKLAARYRDDQNMRVITRETADYRSIVYPMGNPVTAEPAIRRALDYAVDRKAMVEGILQGAGRPAHGPVSPATEWYEPSIEHPMNRQKARTILTQAGWISGSGGVRSKNGRAARFTVMYPAGDTIRRQLALAFAADAKGIGIDVKLEGLGWDAIEPRMKSDAVVMGFGNPYDPDFVNYGLFHPSLAGQGFNNVGHYDNPAVTAALEKGRRKPEEQTRMKAYSTLQKELAADPPATFLTYIDHVYVVRDAWTGLKPQVEPHAHGLVHGPWWNLADWKPAGAAGTTG